MRKLMNMKPMSVLILVALAALEGCLIQEDPFRPIISRNLEQCVTPIQKVSMKVSSGGISATSDGWLFGVAGGDVRLFTNQGELLWTGEGIGSTGPFLSREEVKEKMSAYRNGHLTREEALQWVIHQFQRRVPY